MQPQLVCGKASSTCVTIPHSVIVFPTTDSSHVSVVGCSRFPRAMRRQMNWQIRLANYGVLSLRGRHSMLTRFAALSGNEAVELERFGSKGNLNGESGLRGQEGLVFSVGTSAPSPMSFREWYMADKQLVVISFSAFVVCFSSSQKCWMSWLSATVIAICIACLALICVVHHFHLIKCGEHSCMLVCSANDFCIFNGYIDRFMLTDNWIHGNFTCSCYSKSVGNLSTAFLQLVFLLLMPLGSEIGHDTSIFSFLSFYCRSQCNVHYLRAQRT